MKITWRELLLAAGSGALTAVAFPRLGLWFLAWVSLVPLFYLLSRHSPGQSFFLCFLAGSVFYGILLNWIPAVPAHYGNLSKEFSFLIYLVLVLLLGLFWGLFGLLFGQIRHRFPRLAFWLAPLAWIGVEFLLTFVLTGFPWGVLGYTQYRNPWVLQTAALAGVFGVSFLIVLLQSLFVLSMTLEKRAAFFFGLTFVLLAHAAGLLSIKKVEPTPESFTAGIIQGNVSPAAIGNRLSPREVIDLFDQHLNLSRQAIKEGAGLVVWPEYSVPLCFSCSEPLYVRFRNDLVRFVKTTKSTLLVGSIETSGPPENSQTYNSALCLAPDESLSQYAKMHLVPFGEYTPYPAFFSWVNKMTQAIGMFTPGTYYAQHQYKGLKFGSPICFEIIFPDLVRQFVRQGATFLVTITNDSWYGRSWAPSQHFAIAVFRAVENRRFLLRAATTGISGLVDPYGRILAKSKLQTRTFLTGTVTPERIKTVYTRNGDLLPEAGLTLTFVFFMLALLTRPHEGQKRDSARRIY